MKNPQTYKLFQAFLNTVFISINAHIPINAHHPDLKIKPTLDHVDYLYAIYMIIKKLLQ